MIDIKLRNVKFEDISLVGELIRHFMRYYSDRRGISSGVGYGARYPKFYVYRTDKTVVCVGDYGVVDK